MLRKFCMKSSFTTDFFPFEKWMFQQTAVKLPVVTDS